MTAHVRRIRLSASLRLSLLGTSALIGTALLAQQASAQSIAADALPDLANAGGATVINSATGGSATNNNTDVNLNGASRVLDWNSYNIGSNATVNYSSASGSNLVALNRVITSGSSTIDGAINASDGISVWLVNQDGITFNGSANLSGGSLVLSTLGAAAPGALAGNASVTFSGLSNGVVTLGGTVDNGSLIAVARNVGTSDATSVTGGSAVLVSATSVTFAGGVNSPLAFTINAGTPLTGSVNVEHDIAGQSVVIAGNLQNTLTAALLNVDANAALTATDSNGSVVLATKSITTGSVTVDIANNPLVASSIAVDGAIETTGGVVALASSHDVTTNGTINAGSGSIAIDADDAAIGGDLTAGGTIGITVAGNLTGAATIQAAGTVDVTVSGDADTTGSSYASTGSSLSVDVAGDATLGALGAADGVSLTVDGAADVTGAIDGGLVTAVIGESATFAAITSDTDIRIAAGLAAGSTGTLDMTGALSAGSAGGPVTPGNITLTTDGALTVAAGVTAIGDYTLSASAITLGTAGTPVTQQATGGIDAHATGGDIRGLGGLTLRANNQGDAAPGAGNLLLRAENGAIAFDRTTTIAAGLPGNDPTLRSNVELIFDDGTDLALGNVTAAAIVSNTVSGALAADGNVTTGNLDVHSALRVQAADGFVDTGDITLGQDGDALQVYAGGSGASTGAGTPTTGTIATGNLITNRGDIFVSAAQGLSIGDASTGPGASPAGVIGLLAGNGGIAAGALVAGGDIAAQASGTITIADADAGDDIDLFSTTGNVNLASGSALDSGSGGFRVAFDPATAGEAGSISIAAGEDSQLAASTIRLRALVGDVGSTGTLTTADGSLIANAAGDVALNTATIAGAIAVRAGGDVTHNPLGTLTSTRDDVAIRAGGDATLGTIVAADDIDLDVAGNLTWGTLRITGRADAGTDSFIDVTGGTAGALNGVTFTAPDDAALAGANVVRIVAGSVGGSAVGDVGLIAQDVDSGDFTATARNEGDVRLGTVQSSGSITVTAVNGSVTGVSGTYAPATGGDIAGGNGGVQLSIGSTGVIGTITTGGAVTNLTDAQILRIESISASSVTLQATETLDIGQIRAGNGSVDLTTTASTREAAALEIVSPGTALAQGYEAANLISNANDGTISVDAALGIAQLGVLQAGTGSGAGGIEQITVTAQAMTVAQADAFDGSLMLTASDGLLRLDDGTAAQNATLTKRNDDATSVSAATDFVQVGTLTAGFGIGIASETAASIGTATANGLDGGNLFVSAANSIDINEGSALNGSIGLQSGAQVTSTVLLDAAQDVAILAATGISVAEARAGDDIDFISAGGTVALGDGTASGTWLTGGSVAFSGIAGQTGTVTIDPTEPVPLAGSTISLLAENGSVRSNGTLHTLGVGEILLNASGSVLVNAVAADFGSIGVLAGTSVGASGGIATLAASEDIRVLAGSGITIDSAVAGDDIDMLTTGGDLALADGTSTGLGIGGTSILFAGAGSSGAITIGTGEDSALSASTIRLRAQGGDVLSTGTLATRAAGDVLINAFDNALLGTVQADAGSIGILAGANVDASVGDVSLAARDDIAVLAGGSITIGDATAGDDIDMVALGGTLSLENGTSTGLGTQGTSIGFGAPGAADAVSVLSGLEDTQLADSTIRLRSQTGGIVSTGTLQTLRNGDVLVNASSDALLNTVKADAGSIGILAGGEVGASMVAVALEASEDIGVRAATGITIGTATAGDDIDMVTTAGLLSLTDATSTGLGAGGTSVVYGAAGTAGAIGVSDPVTQTEDAQLTEATIRLRSETGAIVSIGTLQTLRTGDVLVNASGDALLNTVKADAGSIGILAGGEVGASMVAVSLEASEDIGVRAATGITIGTATAGDDIDMVTTAGLLSLTDATSTGLGAGGTSVVYGAAGTAGAVGVSDPVTQTEDAQLTEATIRLRSETGGIASTGTLKTEGAGQILVNASGNVQLGTVEAQRGSIGVLAGRGISAAGASAVTLTASEDVTLLAGTDITIGTATAGDDVDMVTASGNIALVSASSTGTGPNDSAVTFGTAGTASAIGFGAEDAQLTGRSIRLRAASGSITSTGTLRAQGTGNLLVNAATAVDLNVAIADAGSVGVLAGGRIAATRLEASRDIAVRGGTATGLTSDIVIASATAGDDLDIVALNGTIDLTNGLSTGAGAGGSGVVFTGLAGSAAALDVNPVVEDAQLAAASIRLRSQNGAIVSGGTLHTQGSGEIFVNADTDVSLAAVIADGGSIGVLAGGAITATRLDASEDVGLRGGVSGDASPTDVIIGSATAGDDIDMVALNGNLTVNSATSTGAGAGGSSVTFAVAGTANAVAIGTEDAQLGDAAIRLRSQTGNVASAGTIAVQGTGELLVNAGNAVSLATATVSDGSIGVLAGDSVAATTLTAGRDIAVRADNGITVTTATAGDDITLVALGSDLALTNGTSNAAANGGGTSVRFTQTAGLEGALDVIATTDAGSSISLLAQNGNVASGGVLQTLGSGDVMVNALGDVRLTTTRATSGSIAILAGNTVEAATTTASEDIAVAAGDTVTLTANTSAGDDIAIVAGGLVTIGGAARIDQTATGADGRRVLIGTAGDPLGIAFTAEQAVTQGATIAIDAPDIALPGTLGNAGVKVALTNNGTAATVVGGGSGAQPNSFRLDNGELGRITSQTLTVDSRGNDLTLEAMTIGGTTGSAGVSLLSTGKVSIVGAVAVDAVSGGNALPDRTIQIGGTSGALGETAATNALASEIIAILDGAGAPSITAPSAAIDLRGQKILFGTQAMVSAYRGLSDAEIAAKVADPTSLLYRDPTARNVNVFLTARQAKVGYTNFALFQNTLPSGNRGVLINSQTGGALNLNTLALELVSTGDAGSNSFSMFGVINNFEGTTAAFLTNQAIQIANPDDPNAFRVVRANSRINGCVIGAPDRGCLATDIPQPNFNFYDERKIALFDIDDDTAITISPLIGRGNEGLIVNVADAPIGIDTLECRPENPDCPAQQAPASKGE